MPKHGHSIRETNRFVALPGASEHGSPQRQAIDFITPQGINGEDRPEEFEELQEYGWPLARAREFGFHLSYPRAPSTSSRQAAAFEPWHWHYEAAAPVIARKPEGLTKQSLRRPLIRESAGV
jgi:D-alanyl-D-alanine carboxypeptidase